MSPADRQPLQADMHRWRSVAQRSPCWRCGTTAARTSWPGSRSCPVTDNSARHGGFVLQGSPACRATLHQMLRRELLQHVFAGVVLVVAAALTLAVSGQAASCNTCGVTTRYWPIADLLELSRRSVRPGLDPQRTANLGGPDWVASDQPTGFYL